MAGSLVAMDPEAEVDSVASGLGGNADPLLDFSIEDQRALSGGGGGGGAAAAAPVVGSTVTLVSVCVCIDVSRGGEAVLMVQEAKRACAGKWYLPAGRVEKRERLAAAARRELIEETALDGEPRTLLAVETVAGCWFRFVFAADTQPGEPKTPARADADSLQAKWVNDLSEVSLRADDILPLIERARAHKTRPNDRSWHEHIMPVPQAHARNLLRVVAVIKRRSNNRVHVLFSEKTSLHLPVAELDVGKSVHSTLRKFLIDIFGSDLPQHRPHGILSVEHDPSLTDDVTTDGICLSVLVAFRPPLEEVPIIGKYVWQEVSKPLGEKLLSKLSSKTSTVLLNVIR